MKNKIKIIFPPTLILLIHILLMYKGAYTIFPFLDIPMHFFGGGAIAFSFILILKELNITIDNKFYKIIVIISFVGLIGIFWEFFEFGLDYFFKIGLNDLKDALSDLFLGLVGGLIVSIIKNEK